MLYFSIFIFIYISLHYTFSNCIIAHSVKASILMAIIFQEKGDDIFLKKFSVGLSKKKFGDSEALFHPYRTFITGLVKVIILDIHFQIGTDGLSVVAKYTCCRFGNI